MKAPGWLIGLLGAIVGWLKGFVDGEEAMAKKFAESERKRKDALVKEYAANDHDNRSLDDALDGLRERPRSDS